MNDNLAYLEACARPVAPNPVDNWAAQHVEELKWINTSTFEFAGKMKLAYMQWGRLTEGQLAAVRKCMGYNAHATAARRSDEQDSREEARRRDLEIDLTKVPSGYYAAPDGSTRLKVRINRGTNRWQGYIFVTDGAVYGQARNYGMQRPGGVYQGQIEGPLRAIIADPAAASAAYGRLTGSCGVCGRHLEDELSVARGIGPICADKMGW